MESHDHFCREWTWYTEKEVIEHFIQKYVCFRDITDSTVSSQHFISYIDVLSLGNEILLASLYLQNNNS